MNWAAFVPSEEQKVIASVADRRCNKALKARAGTGKSTTAKFLVATGVIPQKKSVLACAFNASARDELLEFIKTLPNRPGKIFAKTFNSMGAAALRSALGTPTKALDSNAVQVVDNKYQKLAQEWALRAEWYFKETDSPDDKSDEIDEGVKLLTKLIQMFMVNTTFEHSQRYNSLKLYLGYHFVDHDPSDVDSLEALATRYSLNNNIYPENEQMVYHAVAGIINQGYEMMVSPDHIITFTEQIYWAVVKRWKVWTNQVVIVDEAQDLSPLERSLVDMHVSWNYGGYVIIIGDDKQAIYEFKGADSDGFDNSCRFWDVTPDMIKPLFLTRRCSKNGVKLVQSHVPGYTAHGNNVEGVIKVIDVEAMLQMVRPGDALISRVRAPMIKFWRLLIAMKIPAVIVGRDNTSAITGFLRKVGNMKDFTFDKLDDFITLHSAKKVARMTKAGKTEQEIEEWLDLVATVRGAVEAVPDALSLDSLMSGINTIFKTTDDPTGNDSKTRVMIMTGHGSKGLEFDRVFNITPDKFPMGAGSQELNLSYVVDTRHKKEMYYVSDDQKVRDRKTAEIRSILNPAPVLKTESVAVIATISELDDFEPDFESDDLPAIKNDPMFAAHIASLAELVTEAPVLQNVVIDTSEPQTAQSDPVALTSTAGLDTLANLKMLGDQLMVDLDLTTPTQAAQAGIEADQNLAVFQQQMLEVPPVESIPDQVIDYASLDPAKDDYSPEEIVTLFDVTHFEKRDGEQHLTPAFRHAYLTYHVGLYEAHPNELSERQSVMLPVMKRALAQLEPVNA